MADQQRRTLTVSVQSHEQSFERSLEAARRIDRGEGYQGEFYSFETLPLLFGVFTPKRWELIGSLQRLGPSSLRGLARELGRDVKRVHEDATTLLKEGIIERDVKGKLFVPFAHIHIEADLFAREASGANMGLKSEAA